MNILNLNRGEIATRKLWQLLLLISLGSLLGMLETLTGQAAQLRPYMVHDQQHFLTTRQKQRIIKQNLCWQQQRNQAQLWVYTFKNQPQMFSALETDDESKSDKALDGSTAILTHTAQQMVPRNGAYDWSTMVNIRADKLERHVSILMIYPVDNHWDLLFSPSEDLSAAMSDFQSWQLNLGLSNKEVDNATLMKYVHRYTSFINQRVANVKVLDPGVTWNNLVELLFGVLLIVGIIAYIRWLHKRPPTGGDSGNDFDDGFMTGWWLNH